MVIMNRNRRLVKEDTYYNTDTASGTSQIAPFSITKGEIMNDEGRSLFHKYTNPFSNDPSFGQKRFSRYVTKVADILLEYIRNLYPNQRIYNFNEWYIEVLYSYFNEKINPENNPRYEYAFSNLVNTYAVSFSISFDETKENMLGYLAEPYSREDDLSVNEIITRELHNACKKYLARKAAADPELTEANYLARGIPETAIEKLNLLDDILNRCIVSIEHICSSDFSVSLIELLKNNAFEQACHQIEERDTRIKELEKELQISQFQAKEEKQEKEKVLKMISENKDLSHLNELNQTCHQLAKRKIHLQKNQIELFDKPQHKFFVFKKTQKQLPELDSFGNYVFLVNPDLRMAKRITDEFPNSRIISGNKKIDLENSDMVIAMTRSISHSWYYGIKNQCKTKDIPFIHCPITNMDELKLLIQKNQQ